MGIAAVAFATWLTCNTASSQNTEASSSPNGAEALAKLDELLTVLTSFNSDSFGKIAGANDKAEQIATRLYELTAGLADRAERGRASSITRVAGELDAAITGSTTTLKSSLQQGDESSEALNKLRETISSLGLRKPGLVLRVLEAKFGDTFSSIRPIAARWCDATSYMRNKCDRSGSCSLDANYQDTVCGFNPAPSADLRDRGLFVDYQCVPNIEASFSGDYAPKSVRSSSPFLKKSKDEYVVLRGNGAIICGTAK
ncbi:hypothetical protein U8P76_30675 (plasmid) [Rhizobium johnstonii]|nr:hypothetical protein U8P76_30675 [Rhizobium johnstonii]